MLKLEDICIALFDFDDTLCVHTKRPQSWALPDRQYNRDVLAGVNPWWDGVAPAVMQEFVHLCLAMNIAVGLISSTGSYLRAEAKVHWVKENYGVDMPNYCVGSPDSKIWMAQSVCDYHHLTPDKVLFVDDLYDNLEKMGQEGFVACSPMEIVYFMEQRAAQKDA